MYGHSTKWWLVNIVATLALMAVLQGQWSEGSDSEGHNGQKSLWSSLTGSNHGDAEKWE